MTFTEWFSTLPMSSMRNPDPYRLAWDAAMEQVAKADIIGWATHHEPPMLFPTREEAVLHCDDDEEPIPLVAAHKGEGGEG